MQDMLHDNFSAFPLKFIKKIYRLLLFFSLVETPYPI